MEGASGCAAAAVCAKAARSTAGSRAAGKPGTASLHTSITAFTLPFCSRESICQNLAFRGFCPQLCFCIHVVCLCVPDVYISVHIYKVYTCTCLFPQNTVQRAVPSHRSILLADMYLTTRNINTSASPVTVSLPEGALENIVTETLIFADSRAPPAGKPGWTVPLEGPEGSCSPGRLGRTGGEARLAV